MKGSYCCIHAGVELLHVSVCDNQWCEQMDLWQEVRKLCCFTEWRVVDSPPTTN